MLESASVIDRELKGWNRSMHTPVARRASRAAWREATDDARNLCCHARATGRTPLTTADDDRRDDAPCARFGADPGLRSRPPRPTPQSW